MASLAGEIKRGFLRGIYLTASNSAFALSDALNSFTLQGFGVVQTGQLVLTSGGNGHSVTFQVPSQWQTFSPEEVFSLAEEFQAVYSDALVTLSSQGNATPTDAQIFAIMIADVRLATINVAYSDFTLLNQPRTL